MSDEDEPSGMPIGAEVRVDGMLVIGQELRTVMVRGVLGPEEVYQFRLELVPVAIAGSGSEPAPPSWTQWMTVRQNEFAKLLELWQAFQLEQGHLARRSAPGSTLN